MPPGAAILDGPILIVEDDEDIRETLADVLMDGGYAVVCAENGKEALGLLRNGLHPTCILLDLAMPQMDGQSFRGEQLRDPEIAQIPVLVMTGDRALPNGAAFAHAEHVPKPAKIEEILAAVAKYSRPISPSHV